MRETMNYERGTMNGVLKDSCLSVQRSAFGVQRLLLGACL